MHITLKFTYAGREYNCASWHHTPLMHIVMDPSTFSYGEDAFKEFVLNNKNQVNDYDGDNFTPLMGACLHRQSYMAKILIESGATLNNQTKKSG